MSKSPSPDSASSPPWEAISRAPSTISVSLASGRRRKVRGMTKPVFTGNFTQQEPIPEEGIEAALTGEAGREERAG